MVDELEITKKKVNDGWNLTMRVLLGGEVGDIDEYSDWLCKFHQPKKPATSMVSGKNVVLAYDHYGSKTKYVSLDEFLSGKWQPTPLDINQIKDIDSIVEGLRENLAYVGNVVAGNSKNVVDSTHVFNSSYVYGSRHIYDSKYIGYSERTNLAQYLFGVVWGGAEISFTVLGYACGTRLKKAFNVIFTETNSDVYFTAGVYNSQEIMFSFGQRGKRYVIGNHQLSKEEYMKIKQKLLEDIRSDLERNKKIPHVLELVEDKKIDVDLPENEYERLKQEYAKEDQIRSRLKANFPKIPTVVLGKKYGYDEVSDLLNRHIPPINKTLSMITQKQVDIPAPLLPARHRAVEYELLDKVSARLKSETPSLTWKNIREQLNKFFLFGCDNRVGNIQNIVDSVQRIDSQNVIGSTAAVWSKYVYNSWWVGQCSWVAGSSTLFFSDFVMNAYASDRIKRSFEVDSSTNLSDAYYVHNCHGCSETMFSMHLKGKRHVIGNLELPPAEYKRIKTQLLEELNDRIAHKQNVPDIFSLL